ncbi:MAG: extracellular solute-binding protein [Gemmiger sp.]|nr:extracellular solute-binding protein [Gemmiger sp.]
MKKLTKLLALALPACMAFTACGQSAGSATTAPASTAATTETTTSAAATPTGEKMELTLWLTPSWKGVFSGDEPGADYDSFFIEAGKRYTENVNPNVTIKVEVIPGDTRDEKVSVAESTNTLPDLFYEGAFTMSSYYHNGSIVPLTDIVGAEDKTDIADGIWENCMVEDEIFVFPFAHMPGTLVYNADMLKAAGLEQYIAGEYEIATWTPDELKTILQTLHEKQPEVYPLSLFAMNNQGDTWNLTWLRMYGSKFFGPDGKLIVNDGAGVQALQYLIDLKDAGLTVPGPESLTSNDCNAMFQNKQVAVSFTNSTLFTNLQTDMNNGTLEKFDARLANIPGDPAPNSFTYVSGFMAMNTGNDARIAAAKDFIRYVCTDPALVLASKNTLPVRETVTKQVSGEMPYLQAYTDNAKFIYNFSNNMPGYKELRNVLFPELQAAFTGEKTAQQALDSYVEKGNAVIEEGRKVSVIYN